MLRPENSEHGVWGWVTILFVLIVVGGLMYAAEAYRAAVADPASFCEAHLPDGHTHTPAETCDMVKTIQCRCSNCGTGFQILGLDEATRNKVDKITINVGVEE